MPIQTIAQLIKHLDGEERSKGICVLVERNVYEISSIVSATEGIILRCSPLTEEYPPVTKPPPGAKVAA